MSYQPNFESIARGLLHFTHTVTIWFLVTTLLVYFCCAVTFGIEHQSREPTLATGDALDKETLTHNEQLMNNWNETWTNSWAPGVSYFVVLTVSLSLLLRAKRLAQKPLEGLNTLTSSFVGIGIFMVFLRERLVALLLVWPGWVTGWGAALSLICLFVFLCVLVPGVFEAIVEGLDEFF